MVPLHSQSSSKKRVVQRKKSPKAAKKSSSKKSKKLTLASSTHSYKKQAQRRSHHKKHIASLTPVITEAYIVSEIQTLIPQKPPREKRPRKAKKELALTQEPAVETVLINAETPAESPVEISEVVTGIETPFFEGESEPLLNFNITEPVEIDEALAKIVDLEPIPSIFESTLEPSSEDHEPLSEGTVATITHTDIASAVTRAREQVIVNVVEDITLPLCEVAVVQEPVTSPNLLRKILHVIKSIPRFCILFFTEFAKIDPRHTQKQ